MTLAHARRQKLLELLQAEGGLRTAELAQRLGASEATVRRDLAELERQGRLKRVHGGALPLQPGPAVEPPYELKARARVRAKARIALAASRLVRDGATVILDSGTTLLALARILRERRITALALDLKVADALARGRAEVWLVGGRVRNGLFSLVGPWAERGLADVHADAFFMGADAVDGVAVTNATFEEAAVKQAAAAAAAKTYLLADRSKFGRRALARVLPLEALDGVVGERGVEAELPELREKVGFVELV
ncbi:DeoR/GlpR family DNA-binding transcription regulator [Oceanithermus profundus]|uniref:Transcriptional regulator, DeoR family n=1 Tax=Oceanithermus profundus (strain DSM 14977 / NBRC 100410 / VKM B-2274 / 506) TaxID=670487 RepID=E4UAA4_OCEP5|nr:DeoR/GlpR family DNA-binding transcription regulator [Oceanithermus profundus]ADR37547.1 transcriptional regulator, DeoR family [Oceanithermus profundus DSM 14977]